MNHKNLQLYFFFGLLLAVLWSAFLIFRPYFGTLVLAGTLSIVFRPLYKRLLYLVGGGTEPGIYRGRESLASLLTVAIVIGIVLVPLVFFTSLVFGEARELYLRLVGDGRQANVLAQLLRYLQRWIAPFAPDAVFDLNEYLKQALVWLVSNLGALFTSIAEALINFLLSLFALYFLFKDGHKLKKQLITYSPLSDADDTQILNKLETAVNSVIKGSLIVALVQGVLAGIGFTFFGVPNPSLWGALTVIAALIPGIGTSLVMVPAVVYLLLTGQSAAAFGLLLWGVAVVSTIDNFIRPKLIGRGVAIHPFVILLSVFGGLAFFGMIGFLAGPLIVSLLFALLNIYKKEFRSAG